MIYPENSIFLAPLCGYTDAAFRRSCRRYGMKYSFTPLVEVGALIYANPTCDNILYRAPEEEWLGTQVLGNNAEMIEEGIKIIFNKYNYFDVLDLNLGCPVSKVVKKGAGAALARNLEEALRCLERMIKLSPIPVTVKTRIVSETDPELTLKLAKALEETGIQALTLHGRILERKYGGPVFAEMIKSVARSLKIPVIANGGIFNLNTACQLREYTECSRVMIARGAIGNPWIFKELLEQETYLPSHEEICQELKLHVLDVVALMGEEIGIRNSRKIILSYLRGRGYAAFLREAVSHLRTVEDFLDLVKQIQISGQSQDYLLRPIGRQGMDIDLI